MALFEWNDSMSVNVAEIDIQHKKLIGLINKLHEAMGQGKAKEILGEIINSLVDYTETHFLLEEKYFDQFGYSDALPHKKKHTDFVEKISDYKKGFEEDRLLLSMDIMYFLKDWLTTHIQGSDKKYGPLFNENGLK